MGSLRRLVGMIAVSTLCFAAASVALAQERTTIAFGTEGAYAPYNLTLPDGSFSGYEPELMRDLCGRMKVECRFVANDWDSMIPSLQAGKFDAVLDNMGITGERSAIIDFSAPYARTPVVFATLADGPLTQLPGGGSELNVAADATSADPLLGRLRQALKGKRIGIQSGTTYARFLDANFRDVADIVEYKTEPEHDFDLLAGRIDVVFEDFVYMNAAIKQPGNGQIRIAGPKVVGPIWGDGAGLGIRKHEPELKGMLDKAIAAAVADGTVKRLSEKWLGIDATP